MSDRPPLSRFYPFSARPRLFFAPPPSFLSRGVPHPPPRNPVEQLRLRGEIVASFVAPLPGGPGFAASWPTPVIFGRETAASCMCSADANDSGRARPLASRVPLCGDANRTPPSTHPLFDPSGEAVKSGSLLGTSSPPPPTRKSHAGWPKSSPRRPHPKSRRFPLPRKNLSRDIIHSQRRR